MALGGIFKSTTVLAGNSITLSERLKILKQAYPQTISTIAANKLRLQDGSSLAIDDGKAKNHADKLKNPDIEDMLWQIYPLGSCAKGKPRRNFDPGRIRNEAFYRAVYGDSKSAVRRHLTKVDWFDHQLLFTTIGGADEALRAVHDDLKQLDQKYRKYFVKPAGTFNWRAIAGTKRLSVHSFGAAIDINIKYAHYWRWSGGKPGQVPDYNNQIPMAIVDVFERHGFVWGGKWYHFDTMHFEYRPALIAIGKLALKRGCPE